MPTQPQRQHCHIILSGKIAYYTIQVWIFICVLYEQVWCCVRDTHPFMVTRKLISQFWAFQAQSMVAGQVLWVLRRFLWSTECIWLDIIMCVIRSDWIVCVSLAPMAARFWADYIKRLFSSFVGWTKAQFVVDVLCSLNRSDLWPGRIFGSSNHQDFVVDQSCVGWIKDVL